jgi:glutamate formiminotransferase/glutamate formiminotransferase/formiminotetrahydrofolate cyclodeaminase
VLACVVNVSEGRDGAVIAALEEAAGETLLDVHRDPDHHRSVLTLAGTRTPDAARAVARVAVARVDLRGHDGVHPRLGALDVVPFVPLDGDGAPLDELGPALEARDGFGSWAASALALPCFFYGPERTLPDVRRHAFGSLTPDRGPLQPHPSAGACAVGARGALVAYNVWLDTADVSVARQIAGAVRAPALRALGLAVGGVAQVSMNLVKPLQVGPADAYDAVARLARDAGVGVMRAELVGLAPAAVVAAVPDRRRVELDIDAGRTIEARLEDRAAS